jgi:phosphopantothenoylcysteine decarboxylase
MVEDIIKKVGRLVKLLIVIVTDSNKFMKRRILLGLTGSVASVLYVKLIEEIQKVAIVDVILTESSKHFIDMSTLCDALENREGFLYTDEDEWIWRRDGQFTHKWKKDDKVLHIKLRDQSSALVIAPCSANTLAKLANGLCDNLLTSVARAWDKNRPLIIAPAMNTHMWEHPITQIHLRSMRTFSDNNVCIYPQEKMLACNTKGMGAMANIDIIVENVESMLMWTFPLTDGHTCQGIPVDGHPGSFKAKRKNSTHTGVDLYCDVGTPVVPVEDGVVVAVEPFTGPKDNSPWWLDTDCVLVEGASGVICYGEIQPCVSVGQKVKRGDTRIGTVLRVIPPEYPQHPELDGWKPNMLHLEVYPHGYYKPSDGYGNSFTYLQDPTQLLINSVGAPERVLRKS